MPKDMDKRISKKSMEPKAPAQKPDIISKLPGKERETLNDGVTVVEKHFQMEQYDSDDKAIATPYTFTIRTIKAQVSNLQAKANAISPGLKPIRGNYASDALFNIALNRWEALTATKAAITAHANELDSARIEADKL